MFNSIDIFSISQNGVFLNSNPRMIYRTIHIRIKIISYRLYFDKKAAMTLRLFLTVYRIFSIH